MQSVQLAASEVWVTLIFGVILYLFRRELKEKKVTRALLIVCITRLLSDAVSWAFDGVPGLFWGILTRCSNYVTFVSNDLVSVAFSLFLWKLVRRDGEKPGLILRVYWALEGVAAPPQPRETRDSSTRMSPVRKRAVITTPPLIWLTRPAVM